MTVAPGATYRVQLRQEFDFAAAAEIVPYLAGLGITHLYCSPCMQAAPGSAHGYDVVDPARISTDLGGDAGLEALHAALDAHGMGLLLDIVPNHMCIDDKANRWWWDVLRRGRASVHAEFFDIDWEAPGLEGRVLLPVLGDTLDRVLQRGELQVVGAAGALELRYFDRAWPLAEASADSTGAATRELLERQHYVLEHWRTGIARINYRRFFDIASLAALRAELPEVHAATHARTLELVASGIVTGLRVDHVDGLHDPAAYTTRLRGETGAVWTVVEKILAPGEQLPGDWDADGTTGYDFTWLVASLMTDATAEPAMTRIYSAFTGDALSFGEHARAARLHVLDALLGADLDRLTRVAAAAGIENARDALAELIAGMPVYRVYPQEWRALSADDEARIATAADSANRRGRCSAGSVAAIVEVLRAQVEATAGRRELRVRFQQLSATAMAKGVEDTAFYRHCRLVALNEVGGDPSVFGIDTERFHAWCTRAAERAPRSLLATATHDTKRGEDARLRVAMLAEMPEVWGAAVERWHALGARHRGVRAPSAVAEYLLHQTVVAAHPVDADRLCAYMRKAAREAKQETSWLDPDGAYEAELDSFVRGMLGDGAFIDEVSRLVEGMTPAWQAAALSQTLLRLMCPGVPDTYQGSELWDLNLVDPDNRRPVNHALRSTMLAELDGLGVAGVMARSAEGLPKLHLIRAALRLRARRAAAFAPGSTYMPITAKGERAAHVVAFSRAARGAPAAAVTIAVRLARRLEGRWGGTTLSLPAGSWHNVLTGETVDGGERRLDALCRSFPVALLERMA